MPFVSGSKEPHHIWLGWWRCKPTLLLRSPKQRWCNDQSFSHSRLWPHIHLQGRPPPTNTVCSAYPN